MTVRGAFTKLRNVALQNGRKRIQLAAGYSRPATYRQAYRNSIPCIPSPLAVCDLCLSLGVSTLTHTTLACYLSTCTCYLSTAERALSALYCGALLYFVVIVACVVIELVNALRSSRAAVHSGTICVSTRGCYRSNLM